MTGSPKECRAHAMACSRLAETLPDGRSRQMFAAIARSWLELATDVENSQALPGYLFGLEPALPLRLILAGWFYIDDETLFIGGANDPPIRESQIRKGEEESTYEYRPEYMKGLVQPPILL